MTVGCIGRINNQLMICDSQKKHLFNSKCKPQHLYILSHDKIEEGDWRLDIFIDNPKPILSDKEYNSNFTKKIIATTTNSSLYTGRYDDRYSNVSVGGKSLNPILPQLSKEFIKKYIDAYNSGNPITEVMVEYERMYLRGGNNKHLDFYQPKVNYSNEISITKVKDIYTKEEHYTDMQYYMEYCEKNGYVTPMVWEAQFKHY